MITLHGLVAKGIRTRYLKDLFVQWRGAVAAYDEGLLKGDAVLGSAVWRNIFKGDEDVDWTNVAGVVAYMRRLLSELGKAGDGSFVNLASGLSGSGQGKSLFGPGDDELRIVAKRSKGIDTPFEGDVFTESKE